MKAFITNIKDSLTGKAPLGSRRSSKWPKVRAEHLKENSTCAVCQGTNKLEIHHVEPFHQAPEKELDPSNLITLCEGNKVHNCHLTWGHLGNYKNCNPDVVVDAQIWNKKLAKKK